MIILKILLPIVFLINLAFGQKIINKLGEFLEKSKVSIVSKLGGKIKSSANYHINRFNKVPASLRILDSIILFIYFSIYFFNLKLSTFYLLPFVIYFAFKGFYYNKMKSTN